MCLIPLYFIIPVLGFIFQPNLTYFKTPVRGNWLNGVQNFRVLFPLFSTLTPESTIFPVLLCFYLFPTVRPILRSLQFKPSLRTIESLRRDAISMDLFYLCIYIWYRESTANFTKSCLYFLMSCSWYGKMEVPSLILTSV